MSPSASTCLEEEGDQSEDEGVEGDRLGEGEAQPADLLKAKVRYTIVGGKVVYDATRSTSRL